MHAKQVKRMDWFPKQTATANALRKEEHSYREVAAQLGHGVTVWHGGGEGPLLRADASITDTPGNCHPTINHLVQPKPAGALSVPQSRTVLGKRCLSVIGATMFNQWSAFYSDSEGS